MLVLPAVVAALSIIFAVLTVGINFNLIHSIFIRKSLNKSKSLTLFYLRFVIDGFLGLQNAIMSTFILLKFLEVEYDEPVEFLFWISWTSMNCFNVRGILVIVISLDRTLAVFMPISYHNFRRRIRNFYLAIIPLSWPIVNNIVLWGVCQFRVNIPPGCVIFTCQMNQCYISYALSFEVVSHAIIALTSLILAVKLFIWNHCTQKGPKSRDLERANYLALIDTLIIIIFDIVPAGFTVKFPALSAQFGSLILVCKMSGYALESWLVRRALKRTNDIVSVSYANNSSMIKSTGQASSNHRHHRHINNHAWQ
ncbi:Protein CBG06330 [Caenorhabditis briggsae]|uniref:Protein CBG06330 n=1 Tax=Caenorhabditis briggsae TaxID=6238 RepID=A8X1Z4_CAEBR|nr:Protein CBG06330 [Caenorhabditis briggsae]CAP26654.1 Protein CBG06330 [Caenorhabditis briggsae]